MTGNSLPELKSCQSASFLMSLPMASSILAMALYVKQRVHFLGSVPSSASRISVKWGTTRILSGSVFVLPISQHCCHCEPCVVVVACAFRPVTVLATHHQIVRGVSERIIFSVQVVPIAVLCNIVFSPKHRSMAVV